MFNYGSETVAPLSAANVTCLQYLGLQHGLAVAQLHQLRHNELARLSLAGPRLPTDDTALVAP